MIGRMADPFQRKTRAGWWFWYKDPLTRKFRLKKGGDTKEECWTAIIALEKDLAPVKFGYVTAKQHQQAKEGQRPIDEQLEEFEKFLRGRKAGKTHIQITMNYIRAVIAECKFASLVDIEAVAVESFLGDLIAAGKSANTRNRYRASMIELTTRASKRGRMPTNPLLLIEALNEDKDRRRPSRAMSIDEFWRLIDETAKRSPIRALYYWLAGRAGLRWAEIHRLRRHHLHLDGDSPALMLDAAITKNAKGDPLAVDADLAAELRKIVSWGHVLFHTQPTLRTWKDDLWRAGVIQRVEKEKRKIRGVDGHIRRLLPVYEYPGYKTPEGQLDRKSLRTAFVTHMYESGVDIRDAQERARHSDINLTAKTYTRIRLKRQQAAVEALRRPMPPSQQKGTA